MAVRKEKRGWGMKTAFQLIEEHGLTLHGDIEHFAELVRADEREACVQDIQMHIPRSGRDTTEYQRAMRMIERIRARGQK